MVSASIRVFEKFQRAGREQTTTNNKRTNHNSNERSHEMGPLQSAPRKQQQQPTQQVAVATEAAQGSPTTTVLQMQKSSFLEFKARNATFSSTNSNLLALVDMNGALGLYNAATTPLTKLSDLPGSVVSSISFAANGKWLVGAEHGGKYAVVWDTEQRTQLTKLQHRDMTNVCCASFSKGDISTAVLATGSASSIELWGTAATQWKQQRTFTLGGAGDGARQLLFSDDGTKLLVACGEEGCVIFDVASGDGAVRIKTQSYCNAVCWSPDEQQILASDGDNIRVVDARTRDEIGKPLEGHRSPVTSLFFTADRRFFVSSSGGQLRLWNFETKTLVQETQISGIHAAIAPRGEAIITFGGEAQIEYHALRVFALDAAYIESARAGLVAWRSQHPGVDHGLGKTREQIIDALFSRGAVPPFHPTVPREAEHLIRAAFDVNPAQRPAMRELMAAVDNSFDNETVKEPEPKLTIIDTIEFMQPLKYFVANNNLVAAVDSEEGTLSLYDTTSSSPAKIADLVDPAHMNVRVSACCFSNDGRWIVSSGDKTCLVWNVDQRASIAVLQHPEEAAAAFFSRDNALLATVTASGIFLWSTATWRQQHNPIRIQGVEELSFSRDAATLLVACATGCIIFDVRTGAESRRVRLNFCVTACWSPDEKQILASNPDSISNKIRIFDAATGSEIGTGLEGHTQSVNSIRFTSDRRFFVSASNETLILWNFKTMLRVHKIRIAGDTAVVADGEFVFCMLDVRYGFSSKKVERFLVDQYPFDPMYRDSAEKALLLWSTIHPGVDHGLGGSDDAIARNTFFRNMRPPCQNVPASDVEILLSAFERDPAKRPSREAFTSLTWRALRVASYAARKQQFENWNAGVVQPAEGPIDPNVDSGSNHSSKKETSASSRVNSLQTAAAAAAAATTTQSEHTVKCLQGHLLCETRRHVPRWFCVRCEHPTPRAPTEPSFYCAKCGYDVCSTCFEKAGGRRPHQPTITTTTRYAAPGNPSVLQNDFLRPPGPDPETVTNEFACMRVVAEQGEGPPRAQQEEQLQAAYRENEGARVFREMAHMAYAFPSRDSMDSLPSGRTSQRESNLM